MAKKKPGFENIVDESFKEGYESEPELETTSAETVPEQTEEPAQEPVIVELDEKELKRIWEKKDKDRTTEESQIFLQMLLVNNEKALKVVVDYEERSTYYLTDVHRACVDIMSHEEGIKKNDIVVAALNAYFSDEIKQAAEERVVTMAIKKLERETGTKN